MWKIFYDNTKFLIECCRSNINREYRLERYLCSNQVLIELHHIRENCINPKIYRSKFAADDGENSFQRGHLFDLVFMFYCSFAMCSNLCWAHRFKRLCQAASDDGSQSETDGGTFLGNTQEGQAQNAAIRSSAADISYFMCFGEKKAARNDEEFEQVMSSLQDILSFAKIAGFADLFPWALYLPNIDRKYQR